MDEEIVTISVPLSKENYNKLRIMKGTKISWSKFFVRELLE